MKIFKIIICVALCVAVALFAYSAAPIKKQTSKDFEVGSYKFSVTLSVDKTVVFAGETVSVTATFTNNSGRDLEFMLADFLCYDLHAHGETAKNEDILYIFQGKKDEEFIFDLIAFEDKFEGLIKDGESVAKEVKIKFDGRGERKIRLYLPFYLRTKNGDYDTSLPFLSTDCLLISAL